ncbi:MAG: DUF5615 family PIN-like protein [Deltaproteobacteria bacterium]|nr:DUF5615 family PIN-like protein [Deltaproteobacteria bacterium]
MRVLANENVAGDVIEELRARGHDVAWIRVDAPGARDDAILARAVAERRLLVTFDKDFGELVFARGAAASCGLVLFRLSALSASELASRVSDVLESRSDWSGCFSVVEPHRVRMLPLP